MWNPFRAIQRRIDKAVERIAQELLEKDAPAIYRWKLNVTHNIDARRGHRANLAHLRFERVRRESRARRRPQVA